MIQQTWNSIFGGFDLQDRSQMTMNKRKAWVEEQQKQQAIQVAKDRILPLVLSLVFPFIS